MHSPARVCKPALPEGPTVRDGVGLRLEQSFGLGAHGPGRIRRPGPSGAVNSISQHRCHDNATRRHPMHPTRRQALRATATLAATLAAPAFAQGSGNPLRSAHRNFKRPRPWAHCLVADQPMPVRRAWSWGQGHCLGPIRAVPDSRLRVTRPRYIGLTLIRRAASRYAAQRHPGCGLVAQRELMCLTSGPTGKAQAASFVRRLARPPRGGVRGSRPR